MRKFLKAALLAIGGLGLAAPAMAQVYYTINGIPASPGLTRQLANGGLPFGHYWLAKNGNWGLVGSTRVLGNIYAGTPAKAEVAARESAPH